MNLYEITSKFVELNNNEELTEEQYQEMGNELAIALQDKSANIIGYVQNVNAGIDAIDNEINRLKAMQDNAKNKLDRFKQYVKENMEKLDLNKIETDLGAISIVKNPISVEIVDEEKIPNEFKKVVQEIKVDKKAIADAFKQNGEIVNGVNIVDDKTSLRIR